MTENRKYKILKRLGQGGMSAVYKARAPITNRIVALKILSPRDDIFEELVGKEKLREIFLNEAHIMRAIRHDHIAEIIDCQPDGPEPYIVLDYFPHSIGSLVNDSTRVDASRILSIETTYRYLRQALLGLENLHAAGIIHRDIKPHNLMISADDSIKIIDFGLCTIHGRKRPTIPGMQVGSPFYTSPEQEKEPQEADERSDLYSIGITAYRLLTGKLTNPAETNISPPSVLNRELTGGWDELLVKGIHTNPKRRFQSAEEMRCCLEKQYSDWKSQTCNKKFTPSGREFPQPGNTNRRTAPLCLDPEHVRKLLNLDTWMRPLGLANHRFEIIEEKLLSCPAAKLLWQKEGSGHLLNWDDSCHYVANLNQIEWQGYQNWRLPTIEELATLLYSPAKRRRIDPSSYLPPAIHWIWSSDTSDSGKAWVTDLHESFFQTMDKDAMASVCAVTSIP